MPVTVCSKRKGGTPAPANATIIYIGRPSPLGNPFPMTDKADAEERSKVIAKYHVWLRQEWAKNGNVRKELEALAKRARKGEHLAIQCWCAPDGCHADVVKAAIDGINLRFKERALAQQQQPQNAP